MFLQRVLSGIYIHFAICEPSEKDVWLAEVGTGVWGVYFPGKTGWHGEGLLRPGVGRSPELSFPLEPHEACMLRILLAYCVPCVVLITVCMIYHALALVSASLGQR